MLGNIGSGKTACMVREMCLNKTRRVTYSNIITKNIPNNHTINSSMIIHKELMHTKRTGEETYKYSLNVDFWKDIVKKEKTINVVLDEAHTIIDSRKSMSKTNKVMTDFMALLRRVIGQDSSGYGELVLISQLERRLDVIAKEMATQIRYHICHYKKKCENCHTTWNETNETAEKIFNCPRCGNWKILKHNHIIEVFHFISIQHFINWKYFGKKQYHKHYFITDIETYFPLYDTLQWENLISEV